MNAQAAGNGTCTGTGCGGCGGGCGCGGSAAATPLPTSNLPGLPALSHRVGTRPSFMAAMSERLSSAAHPQLAALRTRELSDASMAMLDAWATAADVLTFYQERICNEGYLGSAVEQRSVCELAALVGWRPRPGVAATAYLAYTVDPNSTEVLIPAGARANSIPAPGQTMQAFETSDDLTARSEWNALRPRMARDQSAASIAANGLYLAGTATGLAVNDALVLGLGSGNLKAVRVKAVTVDDAAQWTHVDLQGWFGGDFGLEFQSAAVTAALQALRGAAGTATAERVTAALTDVLAKLGTVTAQDLADWVAVNTLPAIRNELEAARGKGYARLVPALEQALAAIELLAGHPVGAGNSVAELQTAANAGESFSARDKGRNPLDRLVGQLLLPGSIPPATAQNLERSYASTFAGSGEVFPQLLTGLHAQLAPTIYQALSGAAISAPTDITVWALRQAAPLYGNNAPVPGSFDGGIFYPATSDWALAGDERPSTAFLDTAHPTLQAGDLMVMERGSTDGADAFTVVLTTIKSVRTASRFAYGLAGRSTSLVLAEDWWNPLIAEMNIEGTDGMGVLRASTAYVRQEGLALAQQPVTDDVLGNTLELDGLYDGLKAGRWVIVSGDRSDVDLGGGMGAIHAAELLMLAAVVQSGASNDGQVLAGESRHTFLTFAQPLAYTYKRDTVTVCGNVAHATHGQSTAEVLGAGNAAAALQQFTLKAPPLTYIAAPTPAGAASTLVVRVNGVQWPEVPGLAYLGAGQRGFFTSTHEAGTAVPGIGGTTVTFGNPPHGQRLPTGAENIHAAYRSGIGAPGNVAPGQISQLATRPLGVTAVTNPLATSGGADPETRDATRANAPLAVTALDRLVSVSDYAAFAATFAGVGKSSSALLHAGGSALIQVTIAGVEDAPIDATSDLFRNLRSALTLYGDPQLRVKLVVREELALVLGATIKVAADYDWTLVEPAVRAALLAAFGFDAMALGQDLPSSAVISAMAAVQGVEYVDLDLLTTLADTALTSAIADLAGGPPPDPGAVPRRIPVAGDRVVAGVPLPAQLACLQAGVPDSLILNEVQP
ncbi:putative baseplate assembly protein [Arthrobacter sp. LAPM80]|uniref:putative baseplate assembly protein n=1 Tax=Arthrobacter sp. LAPM80 TaxID=3141788 RepID=UPI00398A9159